jgi:DNA-directed RNA polymerase II subunit RPB7
MLHLHPRYFGCELKQVVEKKLKEEVEGTCTGRFGYIIMVVEITDPGAGVLIPTTGYAEFKIAYKALLLKPFKNEVVDGTVTTCNKNGFFMDVGPLQIFVSNLHMPKSFKLFEATTNPVYKNTDEEVIGPGAYVRARVIGTRVDQNEIFGVGAIDDEFLGLQQRQTKSTKLQDALLRPDDNAY